MSVGNCQMPWLFLVAVFRPLSMSFSFDMSGKVHQPAAYLTSVSVFFDAPLLMFGLLSEPALTTHPLTIHSKSLLFVVGGRSG